MMYLLKLCMLFIPFFPSWNAVHAQSSASQLFDTDVGTDQGRCTTDQLAQLDVMIADAQELNNAALWAIAAMNTPAKKVVAYYFVTYFGILWDKKGNPLNTGASIVFDRVRGTFNAIANFLEGDGLSYSTEPSFLTCGDGAYQQMTWFEPARDDSGNWLRKPDGGYYTVRDVYSAFNDEAIWQPYWFAPQNGMGFAKYKRPCDGMAGLVSYSELTSAYVETFEFDRWAGSLTMCPVTFSDTRPNPLVGSLADIVIPIRASASRLDEQVPTGALFHHELAHLTNPAIRDYYYPLNDVVSKPLNGDRYGSYNAQSYMYFSMAVWYYLKTQNEAQPLTYYFGWSDDDAVTGPKKRD